MATQYEQSALYQSFITSLRGCPIGKEFGVHKSFMLELIRLENGDLVPKHLDHKIQLDAVKTFMISTIDEALAREWAPSVKDYLKGYKVVVQFAATSDELIFVCENTLKLLANK